MKFSLILIFQLLLSGCTKESYQSYDRHFNCSDSMLPKAMLYYDSSSPSRLGVHKKLDYNYIVRLRGSLPQSFRTTISNIHLSKWDGQFVLAQKSMEEQLIYNIESGFSLKACDNYNSTLNSILAYYYMWLDRAFEGAAIDDWLLKISSSALKNRTELLSVLIVSKDKEEFDAVLESFEKVSN